MAAGTMVSDGEIWQLTADALQTTPKLTELINSRLEMAPLSSRPVLELMALCEPLALADARQVVNLDLLSELEESGLVNVTAERRRTLLHLTHPLYGEVLRAAIPELRRRQLLLGQAKRTRNYGARRRDDALHIVSWSMAATGTADPAQLIQAATVARHANDFEQVITLLRALPEEEHTYTSSLVHGDALVQLGRHSQLADTLLAEAETRAPGDAERVTAIMARVLNLWHTAEHIDEALRVVENARHEVTGSIEKHLLTLLEGSLRGMFGEPVRGLDLLEELEADPQKAADLDTWTLAALCKTAISGCVGRTDEAIAWGEQAYSSHLRIKSQEAGHPPAAQLNMLTLALADAGRLALGRETSERAFGDLTAVDAPIAWVYAAFARGRVEWLAGNVAAARRWFAEVAGQARPRHYLRLLFHACAGLAASAAALGDLEAASTVLREIPPNPSVGFYVGEESLGHAWLLAAQGRLTEAQAELTKAAARARETGYISSEALLLTDIARFGGAKDVADRLAEISRTCDGLFAPARAHLAAALASDDPNLLQASADQLHNVGAYLLAAEAATASAAAWRRTGNSRRATAASNQAQIYAARCPGASTPLLAAGESAHALTRREREIALLAATGTASRDIANALHLSVRTVDNHLQHAYTKLGVTTRRELANILGQHH
ncbi:helix-turn-helix transcriptional regulator [Streptomyces sp900105245]|uniref:Helix-turn-helix transcriptional regulator n=1 Tax=Streptomyces sp. 900105245 TaxID=3154379 RepID=A0ABV1UK50_9ACTN